MTTTGTSRISSGLPRSDATDVVDASKSPNDKKKYRFLQLPNKLQVLLISTADVLQHDHGDQLHHHHPQHRRPSYSSSEEDDDDEGEEEDGSEESFSGSEDDDDDLDHDHDDEDDEGDEEDDDEATRSDTGFLDEDDGEAKGIPSRRSGACLSVGVGSLAEPEELQGLAHYLEHMLFMGSEKYPDENEFESYLSAHGGFSNGATDNEMTCYLFEVGPAYLEHALDMFAQFFISPLFKKDTMERELSAIESEFSQASQNDRIRLQQVLCSTSKKGHPYRQFGWGNKKSLHDLPAQQSIDVHQRIQDFYHKHYSANIMRLVVRGEEPLEILEQWVTKSFGPIVNKEVQSPRFESFGRPYGVGADPKPLLHRVVPVHDTNTLFLSWMLPPLLGMHYTKPADYVSTLLGDEGQGSVLSYLKNCGWIGSLTAGVIEDDGYDYGSFGAKFDVVMKLTPEGMTKWQEIIAVVFEYIAIIRESGLPEWVFEEMKALSEISFRFQEENSAIENCEELGSVMQGLYGVEPKDILRYDLVQGSFNKEQVREVLKWLTPDNIRVSLVSRHHEKDPLFNEKAIVEQWFGAKYTTDELDDSALASWRAATTNPNLALPKKNPYIPRDFTLLAPEHDAETISPPQLISSTPFGKLWYRLDDHFSLPRAQVAFLLHLPSILQSAENFVLTELYVKLVRDALTEEAYHASLAELNYSLRVKECNIELVFGGYNHKLQILVERIVDAVFKMQIVPARFAILKEDLLREYRNALTKPSNKAKYLRLQLLEKTAFPLQDAMAALNNATLESLQQYLASRLWANRCALTTLVNGNLSESEGKEMVQCVESRLSQFTQPLGENEWFVRNIHALPSDDVLQRGLLIQEVSDHKEDKNTHVEVYFQLGANSLKKLAYAELLHQLMDEPLFDTLRTKQELGYVVYCTPRVMHGILGYVVTVQSSVFAPSYISMCIDAFLKDFLVAIEKMSPERFRDHVEAQIQKKSEPEHTLLESTQRFWYELTSQRHEFELSNKLVKIFRTATKEDMLQFYRTWFFPRINTTANASGAVHKKLYVYVIGQSSPMKMANEGYVDGYLQTIEHIQSFKTELAIFPEQTQLAADTVQSRDVTQL